MFLLPSRLLTPPVARLEIGGFRHGRVFLAVDQLCQERNREPLVELRDRYLRAERLVDSRHHANGKKRMAAEIEEAVVDADLRDAETLLPERAQLPLRLCPWCGKRRRQLGPARAALRAGACVRRGVRVGLVG